MFLVYLVFLSIIGKVFFYMRLFEDFGMMVELVLGIKGKVGPFLIFLLLIISFFSISFTLINESFGADPFIYQGLNIFL